MRWLALLTAMVIAATSPVQAEHARHHMVIHVDSPDADVMTEALHNATNTIDTARQQGATVAIEIVANGRGTTMFVEGLSPVRDEVQRIHAAYPAIVMSVCGISLAHTATAMKQELTVLPEARVVPSGALRIVQLQEQHWAYLKP
jgi:hypothetical protein